LALSIKKKVPVAYDFPEDADTRNKGDILTRSGILSDSQAALKALDKHQINSKLVWDSYQTLTELANHNRVQLVWVPGYEGIAGNKTADQLAKTGSEYPFIGPELACGISMGVAKKEIRDWTTMNHKKYWEYLTGLKQQRDSYGDPLPKEQRNY
jgi:hypothetical protein